MYTVSKSFKIQKKFKKYQMVKYISVSKILCGRNVHFLVILKLLVNTLTCLIKRITCLEVIQDHIPAKSFHLIMQEKF